MGGTSTRVVKPFHQSARAGLVQIHYCIDYVTNESYSEIYISSPEDDSSDKEDFSSVRQWCKIDSSSPAPSRFSFIGDVGMKN
ncbi:hypothetical protein TNIN_661 [Trichonephila inaurata madagascariensis]|uniref:Uncharacterized protein n=1 Tax=Trichonephila inaurata madagascariensis TaxID=2747483 RepID=A0A8X6Y204_9ARAC|nr:hypothetical protein TNIN_661 [Trichonephila inaurata madagascariensis]